MRRAAALACVVGALAAACGDDSPTSEPAATTTAAVVATTTPSTTGAPATTSMSTIAPELVDGCEIGPTEARTVVDESRPTPATAQSEELPSRTLDVWIDRPTADGPWPLVIFAHGLTGHARTHETHRRYLAEECFVVIAPAFPLTNNDVPNAFVNGGDVPGQIGDVSFLIDYALVDEELADVVDADRIGIVGHSLGGLTAAGAAVAPDADPRISAAVVMSAGFVQARDDVAVMILHGDADNVVPFGIGSGAYDVLDGRALFVTLLGGDHVSGIIDGPSPYGAAVRATTGAFLALELDNGPGTIAELFELPLDLASIQAQTPDGPLNDWADYFAT